MVLLQGTPGRKCIVDGKEFLFFSGYSYLGMNHIKAFKEHVKAGIDKYGIVFPSSRISNTRLKLYEKFEKRLSGITRMEDTVSFSSGYLAGKTISDIFASYNNILVAPGTHPAINLPQYQKNNPENFSDWKNEVAWQINSSEENEFVIFSDSVDVLKGQVHNFSFIKNIHTSKKITFLIDDSHGIGILGRNGEGIISQLPRADHVEYIICYSLSKAYNIEGGAVSCSKKWAEKLRHHPNYAGSTPMSPALMHAFIKSKKIYSQQRIKLLRNIAYFKNHLPPQIINHDHDLPVFICADENAAPAFYDKDIIISSFGYPDPGSKKINRIVINALHTKRDLQKLSS